MTENNTTKTAEDNLKEIVRDMLQRNIEIKMIIQATGLSQNQIKKIANSK